MIHDFFISYKKVKKKKLKTSTSSGLVAFAMFLADLHSKIDCNGCSFVRRFMVELQIILLLARLQFRIRFLTGLENMKENKFISPFCALHNSLRYEHFL